MTWSLQKKNVVDVDLTPSLTNYWKLDESSGNATDIIGGATLTNTSTTYTTGKLGNCCLLNSGSDKLENTTATINSLTTDFSISFWVKPTIGCKIVNEVVPPLGADFVWEIETWDFLGGSVLFRIYDINYNEASVIIDGLPFDGNFHHVICTYNATTRVSQLYVDGVFMADATGAEAPQVGTPSSFKIYGDSATNESVDEVGIWSKVLTTTDIANLYNSGNGLVYPLTKGWTNQTKNSATYSNSPKNTSSYTYLIKNI